MKNEHLLINQPKREKERGLPNVTPEVKKWGALITWLRAKNYTPDMVRATILDYEKKEEENGD